MLGSLRRMLLMEAPPTLLRNPPTDGPPVGGYFAFIIVPETRA